MNRIRIQPASAEDTIIIRSAPPALKYWRSRYENDAQMGIYLAQDTFRAINEHLNTKSRLEMGGMLIGNIFLNPHNEYYLIIDAILEARYFEHGAAHLTFTSECLTDILERLEENYPNKQIVGWYHSHPDLSIFLSSFDIWLHKHFFPQPWHLALVVDPQSNEGGFFHYSNDNPPYINPLSYQGFYELAGSRPILGWGNLEAIELEAALAKDEDT